MLSPPRKKRTNLRSLTAAEKREHHLKQNRARKVTVGRAIAQMKLQRGVSVAAFSVAAGGWACASAVAEPLGPAPISGAPWHQVQQPPVASGEPLGRAVRERSSTTFMVGSAVMSEWRHGVWFPGKVANITGVGGATRFDVKYSDGDEQSGASARKASQLKPLRRSARGEEASDTPDKPSKPKAAFAVINPKHSSVVSRSFLGSIGRLLGGMQMTCVLVLKLLVTTAFWLFLIVVKYKLLLLIWF